MHQSLSEAKKQKNDAARRRYSNKKGMIWTYSEILIFTIRSRHQARKKMVLRWKETYRVVH